MATSPHAARPPAGPLALAAAASIAAASPAARTQESPPDKSGFTLLDPTPRELRRPLSPDRPDTTESPRTVDAGAVQLEISLIDYARSGSHESWAAARANLKIGLLNAVDLQLVLDPYTHAREAGQTHEGPGDLQVRTKINLWGNDTDGSAMAVMPYVQFPTAADGLGSERVEGGLILPFAIDLADTVGLGFMLELDLVHDPDENDYEAEFLTTAALGLDLTDRLGLYVETIAVLGTDTEARTLLGLGATLALSDDLVLDAGLNIGLSGDADDINLFTGFTLRF